LKERFSLPRLRAAPKSALESGELPLEARAALMSLARALARAAARSDFENGSTTRNGGAASFSPSKTRHYEFI